METLFSSKDVYAGTPRSHSRALPTWNYEDEEVRGTNQQAPSQNQKESGANGV